MSLSTNIALSVLGLTTAGGIIGGSFILLKNNPRNIDVFLEIKQRALLTKDQKDNEAWNANWATYISDNAPKTATTTKGVIEAPQNIDESKNIWNLNNYATDKKNTQAPNSFKDECLNKASGKFSGIWETKFKEVEKYCTKAKDTDD